MACTRVVTGFTKTQRHRALRHTLVMICDICGQSQHSPGPVLVTIIPLILQQWYTTLALKVNCRSLFCYFPLGAGTQNKHLTSCHIIFVVSMQSHREMCWEPSRSVWVKVTERQWECNSSCLCLWSWIRWLWLIKFSLDIPAIIECWHKRCISMHCQWWANHRPVHWSRDHSGPIRSFSFTDTPPAKANTTQKPSFITLSLSSGPGPVWKE